MKSVTGCERYPGISVLDAICVHLSSFLRVESVFGMENNVVHMMTVRTTFP